MLRRTSWFRFGASYLPVILLALVTIHHLYQVSAHGLTRWKGGGFGMFATIDSHGARSVLVYAVTADGQAWLVAPTPTGVPAKYAARLERLRYLPAEPGRELLAQALLQHAWGWQDPGAAGPGFRIDFATPFAPRRLVPARAEEPALLKPAPLAAVRIEVHTLTYDRASRRLAARLLSAAEAKKTP
jgi:hypothetical protein